MKGNDAGFRLERDSMGEVKVPKEAYFGAHTQRAVQNFPISGLRFPRAFIQALGLIKWGSSRRKPPVWEPGAALILSFPSFSRFPLNSPPCPVNPCPRYPPASRRVSTSRQV